jgi:hypothetical protein
MGVVVKSQTEGEGECLVVILPWIFDQRTWSYLVKFKLEAWLAASSASSGVAIK